MYCKVLVFASLTAWYNSLNSLAIRVYSYGDCTATVYKYIIIIISHSPSVLKLLGQNRQPIFELSSPKEISFFSSPSSCKSRIWLMEKVTSPFKPRFFSMQIAGRAQCTSQYIDVNFSLNPHVPPTMQLDWRKFFFFFFYLWRMV